MISNKVNRFIGLEEALSQVTDYCTYSHYCELFIDLNVPLLTTLAASRSLKVEVNYIGMF